MHNIKMPARPNWRDLAEEADSTFTGIHGVPYWDEGTADTLSLKQVETDLEDPAAALQEMYGEAAVEIPDREELLDRPDTPEDCRDLIAANWRLDDPEFYSRFDFAYDG